MAYVLFPAKRHSYAVNITVSYPEASIFESRPRTDKPDWGLSHPLRERNSNITYNKTGQEQFISSGSFSLHQSWSFFHSTLYIHNAFTVEVERGCHFLGPGCNCTIRRQTLWGSPDTSRVSLYKDNEINSPKLYLFILGAGNWRLPSNLSENILHISRFKLWNQLFYT